MFIHQSLPHNNFDIIMLFKTHTASIPTSSKPNFKLITMKCESQGDQKVIHFTLRSNWRTGNLVKHHYLMFTYITARLQSILLIHLHLLRFSHPLRHNKVRFIPPNYCSPSLESSSSPSTTTPTPGAAVATFKSLNCCLSARSPDATRLLGDIRPAGFRCRI